MLESLVYLTVLPKRSENLMSADNQQERLKTIGWIVGFIDGEGCFSITIQKNSTMTTGWQVFPEFVVTQGEKSIKTLQVLKDFFGCGNIFVNRRKDNHKENLHRYCVRALGDLKKKIIPFFQENQLFTAKREDFKKFVQVIDLVDEKEHLTKKGLEKIASISATMNRKKPSKFLASSETIR